MHFLSILGLVLISIHIPYGECKKKYINELSQGKVCFGTNGRMLVPSNRDQHYRNLRDRYANCTYVDGNLELTWLQDENLDLSFLKYIQEVTGYVLISHVDIKRIVIPRLQIIRGRTLFKMNVREEEFALLVTLSKMFTLELPALRDVLKGSIGLLNNYNLCHVKTINWKEIITDPQGNYTYVYNFTSPERECPPCHKNCEKGCWGEGEENCQKFSKENCSPQCYQGRCFGPNPRECCHLFCAGGCTGPTQSDCIACRNFYDDGVCTQECPPMQIYNTITYSWENNPKGKYAYGATCVKSCPEHLLKDNGACVRTCPPRKKAHNGACVPCVGPCPKTCSGNTSIHSGNIHLFEGCTVIEGDITILQNTFEGYQHIYPNYTFGDRYSPMHPDKLEVFSTLKEITGYINIQAYHKDFKNLSYFRNLEVIGGRTLYEYFTSLYIVKTSLRSLELKSLKRLNSGTVAILENPHLCFVDGINWDKIRKSKENLLMLSNNANAETCRKNGLVCDEECSKDGCWGSGPDQCLSCAHFQLEGRCIANCRVVPGIYQASSTECKRCHEECGSSCRGPGVDKCVTCKNFQDGPYCVPKCPINKYEDRGQCMNCHPNCINGCTGPRNTVGNGGCNACEKAIINENATIDNCLHKDENCPDGYYNEWLGPQEKESLKPMAGRVICRKCHPRCKLCTGYGFHELVCQKCTHYKKGEQCEDECLNDNYPDDEVQECKPCDLECRGCTGPGPENCISCHNFKVFDDGDPSKNSSFKCMSACPPEFPHRVIPDNGDTYCSDRPVSMSSTSFPDSNGVCVRNCPPRKKAHNGTCVPCVSACPKTCSSNTSIHSGNIHLFEGCTVIEGDITILQNTFEGYQHIYPNYTFGDWYSPMHPDKLEVFSTLREVTGYINIQAYHKDFKNLSYFRNLEVIGGRTLYEYFTSLYIVKTSLRSLELKSLKRLNSGTVAILENPHLCFVDGINWDKIRKSKENLLMLSDNANPEVCRENGLICDEECTKDGCWGSGPDQCLSCANFQLNKRCVVNCTIEAGAYQTGANKCKNCHKECVSCTGPGPDKCITCKKFKDGHNCVPKCPPHKYVDKGQCLNCHQNCIHGCTGPRNIIGTGGCNVCEKAMMNKNGTLGFCLQKYEECPDGYYDKLLHPQESGPLKPMAGKIICKKEKHNASCPPCNCSCPKNYSISVGAN